MYTGRIQIKNRPCSQNRLGVRLATLPDQTSEDDHAGANCVLLSVHSHLINYELARPITGRISDGSCPYFWIQTSVTCL